ncbi:ribonuclease H2, subunit C [Cokeromyces recurvatus]|uniref:ribonuclease H2, subunit C n=1 Tax=Cokeromyces recurvatus TaxID=90255 RepID=UPI00221E46B9|nr:ribonuclease H2, subunit C [Cokeromyces recurvatus]KAI7902808.1 ribonuclease H2, subunit C [Cokeromyces recurvatus]
MSDIKAHLFPFSVEKDETINSKNYFIVKKQKDEKYETVVLGRKLIGLPVTLSHDSTTRGFVWKRSINNEYNDEDLQEERLENMNWIKTDKTIDKFILWKKDTAPDSQDSRINALHNWIDISQAMNEPIPLPNKS